MYAQNHLTTFQTVVCVRILKIVRIDIELELLSFMPYTHFVVFQFYLLSVVDKTKDTPGTYFLHSVKVLVYKFSFVSAILIQIRQ